MSAAVLVTMNQIWEAIGRPDDLASGDSFLSFEYSQVIITVANAETCLFNQLCTLGMYNRRKMCNLC